jgi:flagellar assembly protein FliH
MSTSCSPSPEVKREPEIRALPYPEVTGQGGAAGPRKIGPGPGEGVPATDDLALREAAAREAGRQEGEAGASAAGAQHLAQVRASVGAALADFARDRTHYFQQVESEVVQLALSIARKILYREANLDPLLLAGMVRVTLEKLESATRVVVRAHPQEVSEFRGYFALHMEASRVPEVVEDPAVETDHCILQTALGTTEVGVEVQLKEIERGLLDLLAKRPASL